VTADIVIWTGIRWFSLQKFCLSIYKKLLQLTSLICI